MRIEPGNPNIPPGSGRKPGRANFRASSALPTSEQVSDSPTPADSIPFISSLEEFPEIRLELVEEVRDRLKRGEHLSRAAAERTAEAILADLVNFIGQ